MHAASPGWRLARAALAGLGLSLAICVARAGDVDVLTSRNDASRTGFSPHERVLSPDRVSQALSPGNFGALFSYDLTAIGGQPAGEIYAQPLFVGHVSVTGHGVVNLLLVATMGNLVAALDADGPAAGHDGVLWKRVFGQPPDMTNDVWANCHVSHCLAPIGNNIRGPAGIGSTPVIDRRRGIVFVVDREHTGTGIDVAYRLHALDLRDGRDLPGSPVTVQGSQFAASFNPNWQNQRVGLALSGGQVVIGFGAYEDLLAYRGWLFSYRYDPTTGFAQTGAMTTTPDGDTSAQCAQIHLTPASASAEAVVIAAEAKLAIDIAGGLVLLDPTLLPRDLAEIAAAQLAFDTVAAPQLLQAANTCAHGGLWMTGRAPAVAPDGRILLQVGNGRNDVGLAPNRNFGNSLLSLDPVSLRVLDSFTPGNHFGLNRWDLDLGGSGPLLVPGTRFVVGGGKQGVMHVWDIDHLGGFTPDDTGALQKFTAGIVEEHLDTGLDNPGAFIDFKNVSNTVFSLNAHAGHIMGGPVLWQRSPRAGGSRLYNWSENSELRMYAFDESSATPVMLPEMARSAFIQAGHPGGILALSADGETPGSAIVWASTYDARGTDGFPLGTTGALLQHVPGVLRAYAGDTLEPLWTSEDRGASDRVGTFAKFVPPTVANGRVYLPNFDGKVIAYGLHDHAYPRPANAVLDSLQLLLDDD